MFIVLILATVAVAFANGANDVSKGIATLVGSGVSNCRSAVVWGSICTVAGALTAAFTSQALVATFSGKGILVHPAAAPSFLFAVAIGAIGWLLIATRTGLPVSSTHSLAGALVGAALAGVGWRGILWSALGSKIALPLVASPLMALVLLIAVLPLVRPLFRRFDRYCICVEQSEMAAITPQGTSLRESLPDSASRERSPRKSRRSPPANGFAANAVTSALVGLASRYALPVSTTHVSSGAIVGAGLSTGARTVQWKTVAEMLAAWLITLPVSGLIAAVVAGILM